MNREIKFRSWDGKRMITDPIISDGSDGGETSRVKLNEAIGCYDYELMQYTGLKDKNGKEIYEGDIVAVGENHPKLEIVWDDFGWKIKNIGGHLFNINCHILEVIGNIYETPTVTL
jgi:uncharacterized phage protein (TIGR01671 family)